MLNRLQSYEKDISELRDKYGEAERKLEKETKAKEEALARLTLVLLNPDITCLCKQCRSRSVGF